MSWIGNLKSDVNLTCLKGDHLKHTIALLVMALNLAWGSAQSEIIESGVYDSESCEPEMRSSRKTCRLIEGTSDAFEYLYVAYTNVGAGESFVLPQSNEDLEVLLIMESGTVDQSIADSKKHMGSGSVSLLMPGEKIKVDNNSPEPAALYVIMWRVNMGDARKSISSPESSRSLLIAWNEASVVQIDKGERRYLIDTPTTMMSRFRMHVTTLNEGMMSHAPHKHGEEEILLTRRGEVEESIAGELNHVDPGSLIFLRSKIPHGIRNIGQGQAEYFALKWVPRN